VSGLEFVAVGNWTTDPWGGQTGTTTPQWSTMASWGANSVRLPLNEASWLGYTCTNANGTTENPDPGGNYKAIVTAAVNAATEQGMYVILDLHWTSPGKFCPKTQDVMADADNAPAFWTSVASTFKGYPNVLFEAFNEPIVFNQAMLMNGGAQAQRNSEAGATNYSWQSAGYNQLIAAIRTTGAGNVILVGALNYSSDLSQWLAVRPVDALNQVAAVWHAYPGYGCAFNTACYDLPNYGQASYASATAINAAGVPVVITEYGDQDSAGTTTAPFASRLLPWADTAGMGYLGWTWDTWANPSFVLIKDATGNPTAGFGEYVKAHYQCRAAGTANCP
jgi:aryl-phospho-beta-D-glucosidase BglC (GH1 family)